MSGKCYRASSGSRLQIKPLNGSFGALVESELKPQEIIDDPELGDSLVRAWRDFGGLLVLRGLVDLTPCQLVEVSNIFGVVEDELDVSKKKFNVEVPQVMRLGNTTDEHGNRNAMLTVDAMLPDDGSPQYCSKTRRPVWHTDSTYRKVPPIGSALYCKQAPPSGAATCWSDARAAYQALSEEKKKELQDLECVCSLAHHDAKVHKYSPEYPTLTEEQRKANPAVRVPVVLQHPQTKQLALYGMNSSTCTIVPKGVQVSEERMDEFELQAVEDESVQKVWREELLAFATKSSFVVKWQWRAGDLVVWDNRCTMHCATGFDLKQYVREMWRTTIATDHVLQS
eukprot:gnl/MRDRNA2_/MRDRNA2_149984_c0_seq1.p1 gnl/MRDRNA2_/MRDRNA2_149984_c0~~gnl/MRDRNA2_/MRDRNA2_149984_c0_seq1.p1  ORF type:complete len:340 (+),score=69.03 gnl/MRDRNA2_/MRDRNA2_149984_c0_seq1:103-1122(+)